MSLKSLRIMGMTSGSILLIEDNEDDIMLMLRSFNRNHFLNDVVVARDGAEALDHLLGRNNKEVLHPMLILLDINLPKLNGLEVLKEVRCTEECRLIPVVVLTSSAGEEDVIEGYNLQVNRYMRKPVDFIKFLNAMSDLGNYWLLLNEPG